MTLALFVVCSLSFISIIIFLREVKIVYFYRKNKPKKVKDCYFCSKKSHNETGVVINLICTNPNSQLDTIPPKHNCAHACKMSLKSNNTIPFDHAIKLSSPLDKVLIEAFKLCASVIPTIIAVIKLTGK